MFCLSPCLSKMSWFYESLRVINDSITNCWIVITYIQNDRYKFVYPEVIQTVFTWINPRTASATRALLRLTPCHQAYRSPTHGEISGTPGSLELTGGEYKTWERIHRGMSDPRLLAIPASWGRVADLNPNWRRFSNDLLHLTVLRRVVTAIVLCV